MTASAALADESWTHLRTQVRRMLGARLANAADADDVVQEVLLKVFRNGGGVREGERLAGWLSTTVRNAMVDQFRDRQRHPVVRGDTHEGIENPETWDDVEGEEIRSCLTGALRPFADRLPALYREVIILSELEGLPHAEIARRLNISISGVKSRVQRGREHLRKMLVDCCEIALDARRSVVACEPRSGSAAQDRCATPDVQGAYHEQDRQKQ